MTIDTVVRAALKTLCEGRVYPTTFIQKDSGLPQFPAIRYTVIGGESYEDICGTDDGSTDDPRVQIDVVANSHAERKTVVAEVLAAMMDLDPPCARDGTPRDVYDEPTRTYRAVIDFVFSPSSETP